MDGLFLIDAPRGGAENMAADQAMLQRAVELQTPLIRFYEWSQPTLSLGYFQKFADGQRNPASLELDVVRRATGGGAIVHHHDWTYAVAVPNRCLTPTLQPTAPVGASQQLYHCVHDAVVDWLQQLGYAARSWDSRCGPSAGANPGCSFLCFERRSPGDIVVKQAKVMGSAQRRIPGAVLQHGSLLLARSPHAPSLAGLRELRADQGHDAQELDAQELDAQELGPHGLGPHEVSEAPGVAGESLREDFQQRITAAVAALTGALLRPCLSLNEFMPDLDSQAQAAFQSPGWIRRL